ncbi:hypothetical protein [Trichlorobacter ammonificans]|uniref:Uncharacterized protein n=1 Tax=Trichlorobacter ammonificans TaxID=2916410 RepID=A0ABN8HL78_9BACT|nr:hypothetical protein [Trichlorobacter ammonificans]CAH2031687.1 exported protein of unknown function [Trichlorobacter ammonificans]
MKKMMMNVVVALVFGFSLNITTANAEDQKPKAEKKASATSKRPDSPFFESKEAAEKAGCTCTWEGREYSKGSTVCKNKSKFECGCNGWFDTKKGC